MSVRILIAVALLISLPGRAAVGEGTLDGIREEIAEERPSLHGESRPSDPAECTDIDDNDEPGFFESLLGPPLVFTVTAPWWIPRAILEDDGSGSADFPTAPYLDGSVGYLMLNSDTVAQPRGWGGRWSADAGSDFDGTDTVTGRLQLDTVSRFGIDTSWARLSEDVFSGPDELWLGDFNLVYRFAQSEHAQFFTGLGVNWSADHGHGDVGFNFTYGADWFPADPWVFSTTIDAGGIGGASLFRSRTTVGAMLNRFEAYGGFDYLNVEGTSVPSLIGGLRVWF